MKKFIFVRLGVCFLALINNACVFSMDLLPIELKQSILSDNSCRFANNDVIVAGYLLRQVIKLQKTSKTFQQALTYKIVGGMFVKLNDNVKTGLLDEIIVHNNRMDRNGYSCEAQNFIPPYYYKSKSFFAVSIILAGGKLQNFAHNKLVNSAFYYNDTELISLLCAEGKINLNNLHWLKAPLFFYIRTPEMAKICEKEINFYTVTADDSFFPNILWRAARSDYAREVSSDLLDFYLKKDIPILSRSSDGRSLLHQLAFTSKYRKADIDFLNKVKLLLIKKPNLINSLNKDKKTPLDFAIDVLASVSFVDSIFNSTECTKEYIELLKECGGKTSQELSASCNKPEECILF